MPWPRDIDWKRVFIGTSSCSHSCRTRASFHVAYCRDRNL
jgi:hypothetical protein